MQEVEEFQRQYNSVLVAVVKGAHKGVQVAWYATPPSTPNLRPRACLPVWLVWLMNGGVSFSRCGCRKHFQDFMRDEMERRGKGEAQGSQDGQGEEAAADEGNVEGMGSRFRER